ncbi:DUF1682-domain-containing protein [Exidia glandulosa HHB12029]|uniref:DUF1682-domain-containing protein n=1 Tax=Exidia glandulosa HHB12029 TaxID=1314781 RepID=A0A165QUC6_EXIGL|nr:DUF1682-domain-containing protein [Exidia glandulosa HHB12029]
MSLLPFNFPNFLQPNVAQPSEFYEGTQFRWGQVVFRPAVFKEEAFVLAFVLGYLFLWQWGKWANKSKANAWLEAHRSLLTAQFSKPTSASGTLIQDGGSDFYNFSTGRRGVSSLHTVFSLLPRHDLFELAIQFGRGLIELDYRPYDKIELDFTLSPSAGVPNFVWAVVDKDDVKSFKQDRWDLTFAKTTDVPTLPAQYTVFTEVADVTETLLKPNAFLNLATILKDPAQNRYFKSLSVSDLPMEAPDTTIPLMEQPKHVVLTLELPSNPDETLPLVQAAFAFVDYLESRNFTLRPETKPKLKKVRADMEEFLKREVTKDDDTAEKKRAEKRKAEQERIAKLSAAEQKKHDEKERKRTLRKAQTRGGGARARNG